MERKIKSDYANKRAQWLSSNGFSAEGKTYIYAKPDSYDRKEELKDLGFKFNPNLLWHIAEVPYEYAADVVEVSLDEVVTISAWGVGSYAASAKQLILDRIADAQPESTSEWIGEEGEKINDLPVTLVRASGFGGRYGWSNIYKFEDELGNVITWFTSKVLDLEIDDSCFLSGTIKKLDEYQGEKQTVMTRCKIE